MKKTLSNGYTVDTWWDRQSRNWITQILDSEGNQQGEALFSGTRKDAEHDHKVAIQMALTRDPE